MHNFFLFFHFSLFLVSGTAAGVDLRAGLTVIMHNKERKMLGCIIEVTALLVCYIRVYCTEHRQKSFAGVQGRIINSIFVSSHLV